MKRWSIAIPISILAVAISLIFVIRGQWNAWSGDASLQKTDDAYVTADQISLSTRISGTVRSVSVEDYQAVKAGQLILELDDEDYQATVDEAQAAIEAAKAELAANQDAKHAADASVAAAKEAIAQSEASSDAAKAAIDAEQAHATETGTEYDRQSKLLANRAATRQQYEQALAARDSSQASLQSRRADLMRSQGAIAATRAALAGLIHQRSALDAKDKGLSAQIVAKTAALAATKVNLNYTKLYAPADGYVGRLQVHPGQLLGAGVEVVNFVKGGAWVEANLLETQLGSLRIGNAVDIKIDAYPSQVFHGHVSEIAPASGAASALLPPDNATGNFTKVIQRVPVKIVFDAGPAQDLLRPGLSAEVAVHIGSIDTSTSMRSAGDHSQASR
jgi:membrane fusion protein (multidrug efflux system)